MYSFSPSCIHKLTYFFIPIDHNITSQINPHWSFGTMLTMILSKNRFYASTLISSAGLTRTSCVASNSANRIPSICMRQSVRQAIIGRILHRGKSTMASARFDYDELYAGRQNGHAAAAAARTSTDTPLDEAWKINLGRLDDNRWLSGPRPEDWFTGMHPKCCPGK